MESHELRLIINAAAAKAGGKQFVAAIRQVQQAVQALDRDAAGSFTKLKAEANGAARAARAAGKAIGDAGKQAGRGAKEAADGFKQTSSAAERARSIQLQVAAAMRSSALEAERLRAKLLKAGDRVGAETVAASLANLRSQLSGTVSSATQVRAAMSTFRDVTNSLNITLLQNATNAANAAGQQRNLAGQAGRVAGAANNAASGINNAGNAAGRAAREFRLAAGNMRGLENSMNLGFQAASAFRVAIGSITLGTFTQSVFRAGDALEQFKITMEVASGSVKAAQSDLEFIDDMATRLGTSLTASRDAFSKFAVSAQIAGVESGQTRDIFESVSTAMAVLGRGTEDQRLAFLALEQMMSKGVISAEELRRQLGERLPGAVNLMARAVGVSTQELQKMLKAGELVSSEVLPKFADELNRVFGSQLDRTFNRAGSNLGRLQVEFQKLLEIVANSGFLDTLSREFRDLTTLLRSDDAADAARRIGEGLATAAQVVATAAGFIIENFNQIADVAKAVFGVLLVRQFALAATAMVTMATTAKTTTGAMLLFGRSATAVAAAQRGATTALTAGAAAAALSGTAAAGAAAQTGLLARSLGVLRVGFAALTGPIGIAVTALVALPLLFRDSSNAAEQASSEYESAMQRMNAASFSFIDTAREVNEASNFDRLLENIAVLDEIESKFNNFRVDTNLTTQFEEAFNTLDASVVLDSAKEAAGALQTMVGELRDMESAGTDSAAKIEEIKKQITALRALTSDDSGAFSALRQLEDILLPAAQAVLTYNGLLEENTDLAGTNANAVRENAAALADYENQIAAIAQGGSGDDFINMSREVQDILSNPGNANGLSSVLLNLSGSLQLTGTDTMLLRNQLGTLDASFDGSTAASEILRAKLEEARTAAQAAASDTENLSDWQREAAASAVKQADDALTLVDAIINAQSATSQLASDQSNLAGAVDNSSGAMAGATSTAYNYAAALGAVSSAQAAISGIATDFREQARLRTELSTMEGEARAVFQDRNFGQTSRAVGEINKELAQLETTLNNIDGIPQDGAADFIRSEIATLAAERDAVIAAGETASRSIFNNNENRREANRGGGGGKSGTAKSLEEEKKAYENAEEALSDYISELHKESVALAMVESGRASSKKAADLLIEAQLQGVITTEAQAEAFLKEAAAAEKLRDTIMELGENPFQHIIDAAASLEDTLSGTLADALGNFMTTGELDFGALKDQLTSSINQAIADVTIQGFTDALSSGVDTLLGGVEGDGFLAKTISGLTGGVGQEAGQAEAITAAHAAGGQQVANAIQQAFGVATNQVQTGISAGGTQAASQMGTQVSTSGTVAATQMGTQVTASSASGAATMQAQIVAGSSQGAQIMGSTISAAGAGAAAGGGGGGMLSGLFGSMGGFGGIAAMAAPMLISALFSEGGVSTQPVQTAAVPASAFKNAPQFSNGTANTSGIPAILHDNEAVVPLSGGRKIPVDMKGASSGGDTIVQQTFNISTPDADSFRRSQTQIAADAAGAGQRALRANT